MTQDVDREYKSKIKTPINSLKEDIKVVRLEQLSKLIARRKESETGLTLYVALKLNRLSQLNRPSKKFLYPSILNLILLERGVELKLIAPGGLSTNYRFTKFNSG